LAELPDDPAWQARRRSLEARIALMRGHDPEAIATLEETIPAHRDGGRWSDEALDVSMLVFMLGQAGRFAEAELVLHEAQVALGAWGEARAHAAYQRALLVKGRGDFAGAIDGFRHAILEAERLSLGEISAGSRAQLAKCLRELGRHLAADAELTFLLREAPPAGCIRADLLNELAWSALLQLEMGQIAEVPDDVVRRLDEASALYDGACPRVFQLQTVRLHRALVAIHRGELQLAEQLVVEVVASGVRELAVVTWLHDIRGRLALARGDAEAALAAFDDQAKVSAHALEHDTWWRALHGRAAALLALGRRNEARVALERAEALLDEAAPSLPIGFGRATFVGARHQTAVELVDLLVEDGAIDEAMEVARRARRRGIASAQRLGRIERLSPESRRAFEERLADYDRARRTLTHEIDRRWTLASEELPHHDQALEELRAVCRRAVAAAYEELAEPSTVQGSTLSADEARLLLFPRRDGGAWALFSLDGHTSAHAIGIEAEASSEVLAQSILGPLREQLGAASSLEVLAYGPWQTVDVHALLLDGRPLLAQLPVRYGLDLEVAGQRATAGRFALIVADSTGDLPNARREGERVAEALRNWSPELLVGPAASEERLRESLAEVQLLHFAGHGRLQEERLASELALPSGDALNVGDILALRAAPRLVVLSGCNTGGVLEAAPVVDLSLAAAFLLVGSDAVIGTTRPLHDHTGALLMSRFYANPAQLLDEVEEAFRRAQLSMAREHPDSDWSSFRFMTL
ncbi:MAG: CHAT domain-containing protein, partial [Myxococcales bacterium]|nr:CHAT domain-containing protein [Myxococcales bacterium]